MEPPAWSHSYIQWLLLDLGRRTGHDVWVAPADRNRTVGTVRLGDICLDHIPTVLPQRSRAVMEQVDVIWFPAGRPHPTAFYEVEHSTNIINGLLRMSDLLSTLPPPLRGWRFTIVAPARRLSHFEAELTRPTFRITGLAGTCRFLSYDELLEQHRTALDRKAAR